MGLIDVPSTDGGARLILITTVDIGDGKSDRIEVRVGDDPMDLARVFVEKHGLPDSIIEALGQHLHDNLREAAVAQEAQLRNERSAGRLGCPGSRGACSSGVLSTGSRYADGEVVFERLYEQAIMLRHKLAEKKERIAMEEELALTSSRQHMSWISQEMMRQRTSGPYENYGEMLYAESLEGLARRRQRAEREKAERAAQELSSATFQPEISRLAQQLWSRHDGTTVPAWQRLSKSKKTKTAERLELLRKEREERETRECTFKPAVNRRSDRLMSDRADTLRSLNLSAHQQLYQDSLRRQQKQEEYANWFPEDVTFHPKILASKRPTASKAGEVSAAGAGKPPLPSGAKGPANNNALVDRLYASYEKLQSKLAEARAKLDAPVDPSTGQHLYKPKTGRAPNYSRHRPEQAVGDYLYSLQSEKEEKARQRQAEEEARLEAARRAKVDSSSATIVRRLQRKRFQQVFNFLDKAGAGAISLVAILESPPDYLDELDDDVRADLEMAARIAVRAVSPRQVKHQDSTASAASSFFMPPPPSADVRGAAGHPGNLASPRAPVDPSRVPLEAFCGLMEESIAARPRPRAYLAPSPPQKYLPPETFVPQIDERSKAIAAKLRPKHTPLHELLHREATSISAKKAALRAAAQDAALRECTFAPRLVSEQLVPEGRVMREVREGIYSHPLGQTGHISDDEAALAALVAATIEAEAATAAGTSVGSPGPAAAVGSSAEADGGEPSLLGALQELAAQLEAPPGRAAAEQLNIDASDAQLAEEAEAAAEAASAMGEQLADEVQLSKEELGPVTEGQRRRLEEIEAEVKEMLRATTEAAAAAERLTSAADQRYISRILGFTQEAVDTMETEMSHIPGWTERASRSGGGGSLGGGALAPEAATADQPPVLSRFSTAGASVEIDAVVPEAAALGAAVPQESATEVEKSLGDEEVEEQEQGADAIALEGEAAAAITDDPSSIWGGPSVGAGAVAADEDAAWDAEEAAAAEQAADEPAVEAEIGLVDAVAKAAAATQELGLEKAAAAHEEGEEFPLY